ncbi:MAG: L-lactate permease [Candidatus Heimdallarchaeota archaeon]|nr:L-lactate permease [Candidatus Heimdallarchaeota archaeon]MCK5048772.1 L-lactate permease [Candidatus Heimdallarchaeota archaeon]
MALFGELVSITLLEIFFLAVIFLVVFNWKADTVGLMTWFLISYLAYMVLDTAIEVVVFASIGGMIASFPISLMVLTSILMLTFMEKTGSLARISAAFKQLGGGEEKGFQIMILCLGIGTFLVSIGATPVTMLPPILYALGFSPIVSISLAAIGYDPLTTFALLAIPAVVFTDVMNSLDVTVSLTESGQTFSYFMPVVTTGIAYGMLFIAGGYKLLFDKKSFLFATVSGLTAGFTTILTCHLGYVTLTGVFAGLASTLSVLLLAKILGVKIIDDSNLTDEDRKSISEMSLLRALSPWLILIFFCLITNLIDPIYDYLYSDLVLGLKIEGLKVINTRVFWQAYFWVFVSVVLSLPFFNLSKELVADTLSTWRRRAARPVFAAAIFFAVAFVMNYSGTTDISGSDWKPDPELNMVSLLATQTSNLFGEYYIFIVPFIGLLGGFISGSETSSIAMFSKYHVDTATNLAIDPIIVGAANGVGGGLASVLSPAKIANAAAVIDKLGIEGEVIRKTAPIALLMTLSVSIMTYGWVNDYSIIEWLVMIFITIGILLGSFLLGKALSKGLASFKK